MSEKFVRATDAELIEAGWNPKWIANDPDREGPFAAVGIPEMLCGQCGSTTPGWTVLNLATATGAGTEWCHADAQCAAEEEADSMNAAWLAGYAAAKGAPA